MAKTGIREGRKMMFDNPMLDVNRHQCVLLEHVRVSDGMFGSKMTWKDGMNFPVIFEQDSSTDALIAEQEGTKSTYKGYVHKNMEVKYHDVFRRITDGKIFRVTRDGDDNKTPSTSELDARCIVIERWELPVDE
jgi:hypothetical protein